MFEHITKVNGYPAVIENKNIFMYKSFIINRQHILMSKKVLNSFKKQYACRKN